MRLLSLELIDQYKGLADQTFDLSGASSSIIAFIGLNGSGKSQLMELIAEILAYIERRQRKDFRVRSKPAYRFEIVFERAPTGQVQWSREKFCVRLGVGAELQVTRSEWVEAGGEPIAALVSHWEQAEPFDLADLPLPRLVGYASGLNENLQRPFMRNAVQYFDVMSIRARRIKELAQRNVDENRVAAINRRYRTRHPGIFGVHSDADDADPLRTTESDTPLPAAVFLDYDCTNLVVAALGLLPTYERDRLWPEVRFRHPAKVTLRYDLRDAPAAQDSIQDLRQLVRAVGEPGVRGLAGKTTDDQFEVFELDYLHAEVTLDFTSVEMMARLKATYVDPATLFWKLYKIQLLGVKRWTPEVRSSLKDEAFVGHVKKPLKGRLPLTVVDLLLSDGLRTVAIDDLSDGESQLLHTVGAVRLFGSSDCLFLFDEPETHLNPSWRTRFHLDMQQAIGEQFMSQMLLSSHSPFLISSLHREAVFHFERIDGRTEMAPTATETFGASFEVLIKKHFGLRSAISQTAVDAIRERLQGDPQDSASKRQWLEESLGESMERAYLLKRLGG